MQKCSFFSPFADQISLQWVPVGGISVKSSSPGAKQPFLQGACSLIWFQQTGWDDGHASQCLWFSFLFLKKYIPMLSHCFIDQRQTSLCPPAKRALWEYSICNVITQMRMAERWTDTNPVFPPVPPASSMVILVIRPCEVSHRPRHRWLSSPFFFF